MNAKKIMGAVLVALLAAALFIGAGAASAAEVNDKGTVFVYQTSTDLTDGVWTNADGAQITVIGNTVYPSTNFVAGTYKKGNDVVYVTYPTATYTVGATIGEIPYLVVNGGNVYKDSKVTINVNAAATDFAKLQYVLVTNPDGTTLNKTLSDGVYTINKAETKGTYKFQAIFTTGFVDGAPSNLMLDTVNALTFTVVGTEDATLSASVDTLYAGEALTVTVKGTPGTKYALGLENFGDVNTQQFVVLTQNDKVYEFTMPNAGEASFQLSVAAAAKDDATIKLYEANDLNKDIDTVEITVSAAVVTATLGASSYFVGDTIVISGTSTAGIDDTYDFYITGTNFKKTQLKDEHFEKSGKTWEVELGTDEVTEENKDGAKKLDVGTYTISIQKGDAVVKTVAVALKQPFISIISAPEVVVQGTEAKFVINAEATTHVAAYVFGTNYFLPIKPQTADKDISNQFTLKLTEDDTAAANMSTGQYFMVIQHPMYDGNFNIAAYENAFYLNTTGNAGEEVSKETFLFNVNDRQTANAAQALCDALDSQNIDDMYVKYSFFVIGEDESFTISEIPSQVAQGTTLTISGVSTANAGDVVTVEMISTAFAAVPKETVGSASFIVLTTEVAEDGTWEVTFDTSDLNVDEYSLKVAVTAGDKTSTWKNVNINVVEAADKPDTPVTPEQPEQPEQPEEPVAPETPGFGALAALAGLGAVAVLLLRRE